jgi:SSS family solute:Na+ symporter
MIAGASGLLHAEGPTLQDVSIQLTSLLGGGILAIYVIGFATRKGDAQAIWGGIACTVTFTLWTMGIFPDAWTVPFDTYYTAVMGNFVMFIVGYGLAAALPKRARDLAGLTLFSRQG